MNHTHNTNGNTAPKQNTPVPEGHVTLIGAGPGHPDYITVKGLRVLQQADIIFYDALIHPAFEEYFPLKARSYSVGKRKGAHSYSQEQICELLVQYAQKGLHVVRLKGGDPFIFGRGGEEIIRLQEEGIPYAVIPGITAAQAAGALSNIPLTHRGISEEVRYINGHSKSLNFAELAQYAGTLVIYMSASIVGPVTASLIAHGAQANTPVALIENASLPNQTQSIATLKQAACGEIIRQTTGPGIVIIGHSIHALKATEQAPVWSTHATNSINSTSSTINGNGTNGNNTTNNGIL